MELELNSLKDYNNTNNIKIKFRRKKIQADPHQKNKL